MATSKKRTARAARAPVAKAVRATAVRTKVGAAKAARGKSAASKPRPARETLAILELLYAQYPGAFTELDFRTPFELLVATMLSAQSTDKRVNLVTPALFVRYPDARTLASADAPELEVQIKTTGFFRQKSKALIGMARTLVAEHGGDVPADMSALTALPGVGRKTANVVLGHALGVPGLPVDRHVLRVANRLAIAQAATPEEVESQLCAAVPRERWTVTSDTLILHGRRICRPRPLCERCAAVALCPFAARWAADRARTRPLVEPPGRARNKGAPPVATRHPRRQR
jgi:endonuclease-3